MHHNARLISYGAAINEALRQTMERDASVVLIGEGVPDPKAIFNTTVGLRDRFGERRVLDMPLAENGLTGICIGAALNGLRPVMTHQRIDFMLLAIDQLLNNAAKWHYMFNGQGCVPLVVRAIIGRGWGQGPQHAQSLQALFAHVPGLKVVMPTTAHDAKGMLIAAVEDNNPVLFIEHRWLHGVRGHVPEEMYRVSLGRAALVRVGDHVTVAAFSYMVLEALRAAEVLAEFFGVQLAVLDMRSVAPLDMQMVLASVRETGLLVVADTANATGGISAEVVAGVVEQVFSSLKQPPIRVASPDYPTPTSHYLTQHYYPDAQTIAQAAMSLLGRHEPFPDAVTARLRPSAPHDKPNQEFQGPF